MYVSKHITLLCLLVCFASVFSSPISDFVKRDTLPDKPKKCTSDFDCNHGRCTVYNATVSYCICDKNYLSVNNETCNYQQTSKLTAFLVSFFVGFLGVDWFVLAKGNAGYIVAGVFKLLTGGMGGIWWLIDWIRILCDTFYDGNGYPLGSWQV